MSELQSKLKEVQRKMTELEKQHRREKLELEEKLTRADEKVNHILEIRKEDEEKMLKLEAKCELLKEMVEEKDKIIQTQLIQLQLKTEIQEKMMVKVQQEIADKLNEEMKEIREKMEKEISVLHKKLKKMEVQLQEFEAMEKPLKTPESSFKFPKMTCFNLLNGNSHFEPEFTWQPKITGSGRFGTLSKSFKWRRYPVVSCIKTSYENDVEANVSLSVEYQNQDMLRDVKLVPNLYYVLRDEYENISVKATCRNIFYLFKHNPDVHYDYKYSMDTSQLKHKSIEVYVEGPMMAQQAHSYDGTLNWVVDNCGKRKQMEAEGLIEYQESPYFYTRTTGYRVQVHLWLTGYGEFMFKRKGVTAQISFLSGKFDEYLKDTFLHRTTVALVNPNNPVYNVSKTVEKNILKEKSYFIDLCNNEEMKMAVDNDTLTFKAFVKSIY